MVFLISLYSPVDETGMDFFSSSFDIKEII